MTTKIETQSAEEAMSVAKKLALEKRARRVYCEHCGFLKHYPSCKKPQDKAIL